MTLTTKRSNSSRSRRSTRSSARKITTRSKRSTGRKRTTGTKTLTRSKRLTGRKKPTRAKRSTKSKNRKMNMTIYYMKPIPGKKRKVQSFAKKAGGYLSPYSTEKTWMLTLPRDKKGSSTTSLIKRIEKSIK